MVHIDHEQVSKIAEAVKQLPNNGIGLDFCSPPGFYPPEGHSEAANFFFFWALQNSAFWYGDDVGYVAPLYGTVESKKRKGAGLLSLALARALQENEKQFQLPMLLRLTPVEFTHMFRDDNGPIPFPDIESRYRAARSYARCFICSNSKTPAELLRKANGTTFPLGYFLSALSGIPGFQDSLRKKSLLLAMALSNRPEKFLAVTDPQHWTPIVDYHLMRVALRLGLVELDTNKLYKNRLRLWVSGTDEEQIRNAVHEAVRRLIQETKLPMSVIDEKLWMAREYCPETEIPDCQKCVFNAVCRKRIDLFQPVYRTMNY